MKQGSFFQEHCFTARGILVLHLKVRKAYRPVFSNGIPKMILKYKNKAETKQNPQNETKGKRKKLSKKCKQQLKSTF